MILITKDMVNKDGYPFPVRRGTIDFLNTDESDFENYISVNMSSKKKQVKYLIYYFNEVIEVGEGQEETCFLPNSTYGIKHIPSSLVY